MESVDLVVGVKLFCTSTATLKNGDHKLTAFDDQSQFKKMTRGQYSLIEMESILKQS